MPIIQMILIPIIRFASILSSFDCFLDTFGCFSVVACSVTGIPAHV